MLKRSGKIAKHSSECCTNFGKIKKQLITTLRNIFKVILMQLRRNFREHKKNTLKKFWGKC